METLIFDNTSVLRKAKNELEKRLNVEITITGRKVSFSGTAIDEYEAMFVLEAINLGFTPKKALTLKEPDIILKTFNIKNFTRRKKLTDVRGRIIGKEGQTKRTIEEISGCDIVLHDNTLSVLGPADSIEDAFTALTNLIRGSKQANVYKFLETINTDKKRRYYEERHQK